MFGMGDYVIYMLSKTEKVLSLVKRLEAAVFGRVQGVSFRYYTQRKALSLGLTGWVRNEADGSVRLIAEGDQRKLDELLSFLMVGPPAATVKQVESQFSSASREFNSFNIRW